RLYPTVHRAVGHGLAPERQKDREKGREAMKQPLRFRAVSCGPGFDHKADRYVIERFEDGVCTVTTFEDDVHRANAIFCEQARIAEYERDAKIVLIAAVNGKPLD